MNRIFAIFRFGWPYLKPYWRRFFLGIFFGILLGLINGAVVGVTGVLLDHFDPGQTAKLVSIKTSANHFLPAWLSPVQGKVDSVIQSARGFLDEILPYPGQSLDWKKALGLLFLLPSMALIRGAVDYLSSYCMGWTSTRMVNDLRCRLLEKLNTLSLDFFNRATLGDMMTRINIDTAALQRTMSFGLSDLVKEPATLIGILITLLCRDWQLALCAFVFLPLTLLPIIILGKKVRAATQGGRSTGVTQSSLLIEALSNIRVIQAFRLEKQQEGEFRNLSQQLIHHGMRWVRAKELLNPILEFLSTLSIGLLFLFICYTHRTIADLGSFVVGLAMLYAPIKKLAGINTYFQEAYVGVERLMDVFAEKPTVQESPHAIQLKGFQNEIEFRDVRFSYGEKEVLRGIDLKVKAGQKIGLVGESGSGKSTLINLLFRFYDTTGGSILIDGQEIKLLTFESLRAQMALVSQEVVLFNRSVADNIGLGRLGATRDEIIEAAKAAFAHDFILQMPQGYDTIVGERGINLSGGQRQRLAIARAFVRNAPILVLDEATASLDSKAEAEVQAAIDHLSESRTVISVAHRLSTLRNCNFIVVLDQGQIVETGPFEGLLQKGSLFARMAAQQGLTLSSEMS